MADLLYDWFGFDQTSKTVVHSYSCCLGVGELVIATSVCPSRKESFKEKVNGETVLEGSFGHLKRL